MDDLLILIFPLILLIFFWIGLAVLRKAPLQTSTHFGFAITLCVIATYALWTMNSLGETGMLSRIAFFGWKIYWIPVAAVTYLLVISVFTISRSWSLWQHKEKKEPTKDQAQPSLRKQKDPNIKQTLPHVTKSVLSIVFITIFLFISAGYFYIRHLESQIDSSKTTEAELRQMYYNPVVHIYPDLRARIAWNRSVPLDILLKLFNDSNKMVRCAAYQNDNATPELLQKTIKSSWSKHKICLLATNNAPVEFLRQVAVDNDDRIRRYVARHSNTPPDVLLSLSKDNSKSVRLSVASNHSTPGEALAQLAKSDNSNQRRLVAQNLNTPMYVLEQLMNDPDPKVRLGLLFHYDMPKRLDIVKTLRNDTNEKIQSTAKSLLKDYKNK